MHCYLHYVCIQVAGRVQNLYTVSNCISSIGCRICRRLRLVRQTSVELKGLLIKNYPFTCLIFSSLCFFTFLCILLLYTDLLFFLSFLFFDSFLPFSCSFIDDFLCYKDNILGIEAPLLTPFCCHQLCCTATDRPATDQPLTSTDQPLTSQRIGHSKCPPDTLSIRFVRRTESPCTAAFV